MSASKINALSEKLCSLLGTDSSEKTVQQVSDILAGLIGEITTTNTTKYNQIIRDCKECDPALTHQLTEDIRTKRDTLIANLTAMR